MRKLVNLPADLMKHILFFNKGAFLRNCYYLKLNLNYWLTSCNLNTALYTYPKIFSVLLTISAEFDYCFASQRHEQDTEQNFEH